jgi:hypothetical protein
MRSRLVSLMLIVPMLLHGVFGCCWHHDHAHPSESDARESGIACSHVGHHHASSATPSIPANDKLSNVDKESDQDENCLEQRCDYVSATRSQTETGKSLPACLPGFLMTSMNPLSAKPAIDFKFGAGDDLGPRLRPHALCSVLLI